VPAQAGQIFPAASGTGVLRSRQALFRAYPKEGLIGSGSARSAISAVRNLGSGATPDTSAGAFYRLDTGGGAGVGLGCSGGSPERPVGVSRMWAPRDHETNDSHAPLPARPATPGPPRNAMLRRAVARPGTLNPRAPQPNSSRLAIPPSSTPNAVYLGRQPGEIPPTPLWQRGVGGICSNAEVIIEPYVNGIAFRPDPPPRQPKLLDRPRDALRSRHHSSFGIPSRHCCSRRAATSGPSGSLPGTRMRRQP